MTLEESIKHAEEVAEKKEREKQKWERWLETDSDYRAVTEKVNCELCAEEHRQLAEWLKELKQLREQIKWIPVSESLPEEDGEYIVTRYDDSGELIVDISKYYVSETQNNGFCKAKKVTAWMPLPEPYKAESDPQESEVSDEDRN